MQYKECLTCPFDLLDCPLENGEAATRVMKKYEKKMVKLYEKGMPISKIAQLLGVGYDRVKPRLKKLMIKNRG